MVIGWLSHLDVPKLGDELAYVMRTEAPDWMDWSVRDLSNFRCPSQLEEYFTSPTRKPRWSLGVKLLIPLEFTAPLLYTDDDVIICQDPQALMDERQLGPLDMGPSFASGGNFPFFKHRDRVRYIADQLGQAMEISDVFERYDARILDAGFFFLSAQDCEDWAERLERFAALPYIGDLDPESHEFRRLDQRFLTAFGLRRRVRRLCSAPLRRNFLTPPPKNVRGAITDTFFVHYMSRQYKAAWMDALEQL